MKKGVLLLSVFLCGACVMTMELVGARVLAPFVGTTITVWTSLIGVILGAMSLGYVVGGKLADKNPKFKVLSLIIGFSGMTMALLAVSKNIALAAIVSLHFSNEVSALISTIILFVVPSFFLAMVSPYAIKLSLTSIESSGQTAGYIYAVSTVGSIAGTFFSGFFLIPMLGSTTILYSVSAVLILLSFAVYIPNKLEKSVAARVLVVILAIYAAFFNNGVSTVFKGAIAESDTQYGTILVIDRDNVRNMYIDIARSSGRYLDSDELVFEYTKYYDLALFFNPVAKKVLAFGGAGYSYPQYFVNKYADKEIDVVELDPKTTELAREYFGLTDNPRLRIFHNDARIFLSNNETKYDAILGDAFSSSTPPFQLVTKEANERIYDSLNSNGVYIVNIIDALEGENSKLFSAYYHTLLQTFSQVLVFVPRQGGAKTDVRNITFVALKNQASDINSDDDYMSLMLDRIYDSVPDKSIILTDEYAPVEYLARW